MASSLDALLEALRASGMNTEGFGGAAVLYSCQLIYARCLRTRV